MNFKPSDWRNPDEYKFVSREYYAWQFIRRNKTYREVWTKELTNYLEREKKPGIEDVEINDDLFFITPDNPETAAYWGLRWLCNPNRDAPYISFINLWSSLKFNEREAFHLGYQVEDLKNMGTINIPKRMVGVLFDLRRPIKPQMKTVSAKLVRTQKVLKSRKIIEVVKSQDRFDLWEMYLRIFDARSLQIKYKDIAPIVYKSEYDDRLHKEFVDRTTKAYKSAEALVNRGYINTILKPE